ncbi:hypothetical protein Tsubulata_010541 [Turnera subulata]|uniref:Uncharacterized protein n=1 Tax=Turnera subulata TaxID=218843 RepID=A0A9Q0JC50_9ROSI|nr:hypothetical protein Tsubulata_010541 [Turnera subulata]
MDRAGKIIRRSIFTLLKDFHYFTTTPAILLLPFSASILLSRPLFQSWPPSKSFCFHASSRLCFLDDINLPQLIFSSLFSLPLALSFLVIAKASIIQSFNHQKPASSLFYSSSMSICKSMVLTYLCNMVVLITLNVSVIFLLFLASSFLEELLGLSSDNVLTLVAAIFYMFLANTMVICNLALVMAGMGGGGCGGFKAIRKACLLRKGANFVALLLAVPINLGLAAIEVLFQYRVMRSYHLLGRVDLSMVLEGLLIAYLFSLLIVLDTIACWMLIKSWESNHGRRGRGYTEMFSIQIEIVVQGDGGNSTSSQTLELLL